MKDTRPRIRVVIVDDHRLVRAGIAALLSKEQGIEVIGQAADGREGVTMVRALKPDVVLMDINMPNFDGIQATADIERECPSTRVLILTQYEQGEYVKRVLQAGASGYLLKDSLAEDLAKAISVVYGGEQYLPPVISDMMLKSYVQDAKKKNNEAPTKALTNREQQILRGIAEGLSNQQIAAQLFISVRTVEFHRANILEKLGMHDTVSLVKYAIQHKIIILE